MCECLTFGYPKLLQSNERKCLRPYQWDSLLPCPIMCLTQHLSQGIQRIFTFLISLPFIKLDNSRHVVWYVSAQIYRNVYICAKNLLLFRLFSFNDFVTLAFSIRLYLVLRLWEIFFFIFTVLSSTFSVVNIKQIEYIQIL